MESGHKYMTSKSWPQLDINKKRFHLSSDYCQKTYKNSTHFPQKLSSFLTENKEFLFLYITITKSISKESSKLNISFSSNFSHEMNSKFLLFVWIKEVSKRNLSSHLKYEMNFKISDKNKVITSITDLNLKKHHSQEIALTDCIGHEVIHGDGCVGMEWKSWIYFFRLIY